MGKRPPKVEGWYSQLADGRIEVFLRAGSHKLRASGPEPFVSALVEVWEEHTGFGAQHQEWRRSPRRGPKPIRGQLDMLTRSPVTGVTERPDSELQSDESPGTLAAEVI